MEFRVASFLASISTAFSEIPVSQSPRFQQCFLMSDRVSPARSSSGFPGDGATSCLVSRILRRCPPPDFGFPRLPASCCACRCSLRVTPVSASSGSSSDGDSSFLVSRTLQWVWRSISGLPRILLLQPRCPMSLRVAPNPASSGRADGKFSGCPSSSVPRPRQLVKAPGFPESRTLWRLRLRVSGGHRSLLQRLDR